MRGTSKHLYCHSLPEALGIAAERSDRTGEPQVVYERETPSGDVLYVVIHSTVKAPMQWDFRYRIESAGYRPGCLSPTETAALGSRT